MAEIKYVGLDDLDLSSIDSAEVRSLVERHASIIERMVNNTLELVVHVKMYEKDGKLHKYSANIRATYPGGTISSDKADWKLTAALKQALMAVRQQLASRFKA